MSPQVAAPRRRRVLYLMHVDWRWIKQRPHFLAEELGGVCDLHVLHRAGVTPRGSLVASPAPQRLSPLLPLPWNWPYVRHASGVLQRGWVALIARRFRPDIVWVTHPSLLGALPRSLEGLPLVYDCMDDAYGFSGSARRRAALARLEAALVRRAAAVSCSSQVLCDVLVARYGSHLLQKLSLVRNGVAASLLEEAGCGEGGVIPARGRRLRLAYIGTIAEWLDFGTVLETLDRVEDVEFYFVGPKATRVPRHPRLHIRGPVAHSELRGFASQFDGYVMPFLRSPLVDAVDPIKLYEYVSFGKEIVAVGYPEVERFSGLVHFYRTQGEFEGLVRGLVSGELERKNCRSRVAFLADNTWQVRGRQLGRLVESLAAGGAA